MIKNILFDMGQVLIRFDQQSFIRRLCLDDADMKLLTREVLRSVEWIQLDRGTLSEAEAFRRMALRLPERLHSAADELIRNWHWPILEISGMFELLAELKASGYGIYLLSNASIRHHEYWSQIPASRFFDGTLISADVNAIKPEPEIYRLLLEKFDLRAEECFFIDDVAANIEGALRCGIAGTVFHDDIAMLRSQLRAAGIAVSE